MRLESAVAIENEDSLNKVVVPDDSPPIISDSAALARLQAQPDIEVTVFESRPADEVDLARRIESAHTVLSVRSTSVFSQAVFDAAPDLRHLALWGAAVDNVSLDAARRRGVTITRTPGTQAVPTAEHALALALALARRVPELDQRVREGEWPQGLVIQLAGKMMGVIGTGLTGLRLAEIALGIGMRVSICPLPGDDDSGGRDRPRATVMQLDDLLRAADVISVHTRLTRATAGMFGSEQFALMKPTALFINTARGRLVNEPALAEALRNETIGGAALDVFIAEPLPEKSPLRHLPNVILTPHNAAITSEALNAGLNMAVDNVIEFLAGRVQHSVS